MSQRLDAFAKAMAVAEEHRKVLRRNFGMTDRDIGLAVLARQPKKTMSDYAAAVLAAKRRLEAKRAKREQSHRRRRATKRRLIVA